MPEPEQSIGNDNLRDRRVAFKPSLSVYYNNDNRMEELTPPSDSKLRPNNGVSSHPKEDVTKLKVTREEDPSLFKFIGMELRRGYLLENDEETFSARREKMYTFLQIPREVEKFMFYGFLQCADSFLFVFTFLPMRIILALWALISRPILECFGIQPVRMRSLLKPAEIVDLLKAFIIITCSMMMFYIDTSMLYHLIKSQSVIKLYIFYNMLEVGDRLSSSIGQDSIDALFWTATEPRGRRSEHLSVIWHILIAVVYVFFHGLLVLLQATTLNVAINANNKALLTIMMSNNFVELKGGVFKKFDKNNLFQVSCSDIRERFHLIILMFIVVVQTMKEYAWKSERLPILLQDCIVVLVVECLIDWIKHAFITRFNELPSAVYRDYTTSLAYDVAQTHQKYAFSDHSDLVARRMGFIPLPLSVVVIRILAQAIRIEGPAAILIAIMVYISMLLFRIANSIVVLGKACDLISQHQQEKSCQTPAWVNRATSPINNGRPGTPVARQLIKDLPTNSPRKFVTPAPLPKETPVKAKEEEKPPDCSLGTAAIFSNSAVNIDTMCLNEELLKDSDEVTEIPLLEGDITRSVPNIQAKLNSEDSSLDKELSGSSEELTLKRAESEPSLNHLVSSDITNTSS